MNSGTRVSWQHVIERQHSPEMVRVGPALQVVPVASSSPHEQQKVSLTPHHRTHLRGALAFGYSCGLWLFFFILVFVQGLGVVWSSYTTLGMSQFFGQDPALGLHAIVGWNDIPFTDRSFVCSRRDRGAYHPVALEEAIQAPTAIVSDTTECAIDGYRVVKRSTLTLDSAVRRSYENTCRLITETIDAILSRCEELGYNVTRDSLRVVVNTTMVHLPTTLPVLIMPFSDNSLYSRYAIPGLDGSACVFRLNGAYETSGLSNMIFRGLNRTVREQKTAEFLGKPGGIWRNGWYEDHDDVKWFSDFITTAKTSPIPTREFDMVRNTELDCVNTDNVCGKTSRTESWGEKLTTTSYSTGTWTLTVSTEAHYGLFIHSVQFKRVIVSQWEFSVLISNISLQLLLVRWFVALIALFRGCQAGSTNLHAVGIGILSGSWGFQWLPILLLSRLKTNLTVFSSTGCNFEGSQRALADTWLIMYPRIGELTIIFYSLLNLLAKLLRRRVSDALFGPTLLFFCLMHWFRLELAESGWFEFDGRIVTQVSSDELDEISVLDFFTSDIALRVNGNVRSLFFIKIGVLALNLLPLVWSQRTASVAAEQSAIEEVLALPLSCNGGLGTFMSFEASSPATSGGSSRNHSGTTGCKRAPCILSGIELLRLGYLVLGGDCLLSIYDWYMLVLLEATRVRHLPVVRVMAFVVIREPDGLHVVRTKPLLCHSNHALLLQHRAWEISARSFR